MNKRIVRAMRILCWSLIFLAVGLIVAVWSLSDRVDDLETQRDIYKSRFEYWSQRAIDDEEKIDTLISEQEVSVKPVSADLENCLGIITIERKSDKAVDKADDTANGTSNSTANDAADTGSEHADWTYAGEFLCTAYCCERYEHICGEGTGITASGAVVTAGTTVAADISKFPFGTVLYIEGVGYRTVQDKGSAIKGNHLDVAVDTHSNALSWSGYGNHKVWVVSSPA